MVGQIWYILEPPYFFGSKDLQTVILSLRDGNTKTEQHCGGTYSNKSKNVVEVKLKFVKMAFTCTENGKKK